MSVKAIIQTFLDTSEPSCEHRDKGLGGGFASVRRALPSPAVHAGVFPGSSPRGGGASLPTPSEDAVQGCLQPSGLGDCSALELLQSPFLYFLVSLI